MLPSAQASTMRPPGASNTVPSPASGRKPGIRGRSLVPATNASAARAGETSRARKRTSRRRAADMGALILPLAFGAIKGRAAALHDPLDGRLAARAGLALLVVDHPLGLEIALLAVGVDVVARRGAAGRHRLLQHRTDGAGQGDGALALHRTRPPSRRDTRKI